jgi:hypothetical protein
LGKCTNGYTGRTPNVEITSAGAQVALGTLPFLFFAFFKKDYAICVNLFFCLQFFVYNFSFTIFCFTIFCLRFFVYNFSFTIFRLQFLVYNFLFTIFLQDLCS